MIQLNGDLSQLGMEKAPKNYEVHPANLQEKENESDVKQNNYKLVLKH